MSFYDRELEIGACPQYSEFNEAYGYQEFLADLKEQQDAGILCGSLVRKAARYGRETHRYT